jgi:hypothetical protein
MFINQTKEQQTQPSSFSQTLQQACTTIDVSVVLVILKIESCFSSLFSLLESRFCCCQCTAILIGLHVDWDLVCMLTCYVDGVISY